ncbi:MAG: DUF2452 domain-containing protein [Flavobacteriales bacterium]|jgi:hypothetical protein|nr:DUF2452 domain-containing protein [Schleiferiaceae bacterium]|tara:strand:+ start:3108 stop:3500 length:393 start_codon:yes stop_codon:yes gene_type:complete
MKKKYPDNIVYNYDTDEFDAKLKKYPTSVSAPSFKPLKVDKGDSIKANKYFESRMAEIKEAYKKLVEEYNWTSLVYESTYSFQPLVGESYYLYQNKNKDLFLSLISPYEWKMEYLGTFKLMTNGKWEKMA